MSIVRKAKTSTKQSAKRPEQKKGPARTVIDQCPHRNVGSIDYGDKTLYPADWESPYERGLIHLLLQCHDVKTIETQAEKSTYQLDNKEHKYTLDVAITMISSERIPVEVKSRKNLLKEKALRKYLAIAESYLAKGQQLNFITEDQLNKGWLRTARLLKRYFFTEVKETTQLTVEALLEKSPLRINSLLEIMGPKAVLNDIYALISKGHICIDWDIPLNRKAMVSLPDNPYRRLSYEEIRHSSRFHDLLEEISLGRRPQDQRRLAYARSLRRPVLPSSPYGFIGGLSPSEIGRLGRQATRRLRQAKREAVAAGGALGRVDHACEQEA
jgi:hypothetical protein